MRDRIFILVTLLLMVAACGAAGIWLSNTMGEGLDVVLEEEFPYLEDHEHDPTIVAEHVDAHQMIEQVRKAANAPNAKPISEATYGWLVDTERDDVHELLVELVAGRTQIPADDALWGIYYDGSLWAHESRLTSRSDFQEAVIRLADSKDPDSRAIVVSMIEEEEWTARIPKLRERLKDPHLEVREEAADSIRTMTGETVSLKRPQLIFPSTELREGMLVERELGIGSEWGFEFTPTPIFLDGFDGKPTRAHVEDSVLIMVDANGKESARVRLASESEDCFSLPRPDGSVQIVSMLGWDENEFVSIDQNGKVLWRCEHASLQSALIYSPTGPQGFVCFTDSNTLRAIGLDGSALWEMELADDVFAVRSHSEVPDWLLGLGDYRAQLISLKERSPDAYISINLEDIDIQTGLLLPDDSGEPRAILGGRRDRGGIPIVSAINKQGRSLWTAQLPSSVTGFALIEPTGKSKVIAAVTGIGGIYLFDAAGTLLHSSTLYSSEPGDSFFAWGQAAGVESDGSWSLRVTTDSGPRLFQVNL